MKTKIIFNSEVEGDDYKLKQCIKASDMANVLWEFTHNSRRFLLKHTEVSEDYEKGVNAAFQKFYELIDENSINIGELVE